MVAAHVRGEKLADADPEMLLPAGVPRMLRKRPQGLLIFPFLSNFTSSQSLVDA